MEEFLTIFSKYYLIILNMGIIIVFASLVNLLNPDVDSKESKIGLSLIISGMIVIIMASSYRYGNIYIFDVRSVVLGISGAFFGFKISILPLITAILVRIFIGGVGLTLGIFEIFFATIIGLMWPYISSKIKVKNKINKACILSLFVNLFSLVSVIIVGLFTNELGDVFLVILSYQILIILIGVVVQFLLFNLIEKKELIKKINKENRLLNQIINTVHDLEIYILDSNYNYLGFNDYHKTNMKFYLGSSIKIGDNFIDLIKHHEDITKNQLFFLENVLKYGEYHSNINLEESNLYFEEFYYLIKNNDEIIGTSVFSRNITNEILQDREVKYLSYYDSLTGFYNRSYFNIYSNEFNKDLECIIIYLDVNGLKFFNDALGHNVGDQLIILITRMIKECFTDSLIFRIGGDEILIIDEKNDYSKTLSILNNLLRKIENESIKNINISISSGLVRKRKSQTLDEAIKEAEDKMYQQKLLNSNELQVENYLDLVKTTRKISKKKKCILKYVVKIGNKLNFTDDELMTLKHAATVYDIGKLGFDNDKNIENGFLNSYNHTVVGFRILQTSKAHLGIAYDVLSCYENYDGTGFPQKLKGDNIPINSRIIRIVDYYSNLLVNEKMKKNDIIDKLLEFSGRYFDSKLTKIFVDLLIKEQG